MLPALLLAVFLPLPEMAAADKLLTSPLFGYSLGGDPFDDGTTSVIPPVAHLHSVLVCHGDWIDGIQLVYILQDNGTFIPSPHGKINDNCGKDSNMTKIVFKEDERLVRVEGVVNAGVKYVSQLKLFTSIGGRLPVFKGGPFGRNSGSPFSLTGDIRGIFGRNGEVLDAIGFYVNASLPLSSYNKTPLFAGSDSGIDFDDFKNISSKNETPVKITNIVINNNKVINGIKVTYMVSSGASVTITHGTLKLVTDYTLGQRSLSFLDFEADEWITKVNVTISNPGSDSSPIQGVYCLEIETTNSKGTVRSYGPFGSQQFAGTTKTVAGVIYGFYGRSDNSDCIKAIGFYI